MEIVDWCFVCVMKFCLVVRFICLLVFGLFCVDMGCIGFVLCCCNSLGWGVGLI